MFPIVQPLAPYLPAGCRAVLGAVPRALFMVMILYHSGLQNAIALPKKTATHLPKKRLQKKFIKKSKKLLTLEFGRHIILDISPAFLYSYIMKVHHNSLR